MRTLKIKLFSIFLAPLVYVGFGPLAANADTPTVLIVIENLQQEYIDHMPTLKSLSKRGAASNNHHAVYPPAPLENAASIMTGTYPRGHGILNVTPEGTSLTAPAFVEFLQASPDSFTFISANGHIVSRLLNNANAQTPANGVTGINDSNSWAVDALLDRKTMPATSVVWLLGGDSEHKKIDDLIQRIVSRHGKRKLDINLIVTSSGSIVPRVPRNEIREVVERAIDGSRNLEKVTVGDWFVEGLKDNMDLIKKIVIGLQHIDSIGAIFTEQIRVTHPEGKAPGALSFQSVFIDHSRTPDIVFESMWAKNYLSVPLIAAGPAFKSKTQSNVPTANLDLAPTLLHLAGVDPPDSMTGRVLEEFLADGPDPEDVEVLKRRSGSQVDLGDFTYRLFMTEYTVDGVDYLHSTTPQRIKN
jgi:hypothetical protein